MRRLLQHLCKVIAVLAQSIVVKQQSFASFVHSLFCSNSAKYALRNTVISYPNNPNIIMRFSKCQFLSPKTWN